MTQFLNFNKYILLECSYDFLLLVDSGIFAGPTKHLDRLRGEGPEANFF